MIVHHVSRLWDAAPFAADVTVWRDGFYTQPGVIRALVWTEHMQGYADAVMPEGYVVAFASWEYDPEHNRAGVDGWASVLTECELFPNLGEALSGAMREDAPGAVADIWYTDGADGWRLVSSVSNGHLESEEYRRDGGGFQSDMPHPSRTESLGYFLLIPSVADDAGHLHRVSTNPR